MMTTCVRTCVRTCAAEAVVVIVWACAQGAVVTATVTEKAISTAGRTLKTKVWKTVSATVVMVANGDGVGMKVPPHF